MKLTGIIFSISTLTLLSACSVIQQQEVTTPDSPIQAPEAAGSDAGKKESSARTEKASDEAAEKTAQQSPAEGAAPEQPEEKLPTLSREQTAAPEAPAPPTTGRNTTAVRMATQAPELILPESETPTYDDEYTEPTREDVIPGGLRMRRFAPPEEAVSSSDEIAPTPNSVELHGFRSPSLKGGKLPMNINGKMNKDQ